MVLLLWFYLSGVALLIGAELNAEIEHASPYGKSPGEKVPGEKKKIGPAAERALRGTQGARRMPRCRCSRKASTAMWTSPPRRNRRAACGRAIS